MSTTAFPVRQSEDGTGCTDIALRHIMGALYPYTGIVTGLAVTGGNTLAYNIAEGVAVCSKGEADGNTLAYYEGGTVDTTANSGSNPRIDVIWITSHDLTQGDSDNLVTVGVTQGTAAASPEEPALEKGQTKLAAMLVPASATTTQGCTAYGSTPYAIPYGGSLGCLGSFSGTYSGSHAMNGKWTLTSTCTITVPTKRLVEVAHKARWNCPSKDLTSCYIKLNIDGVDITDGNDERPIFKYWVMDLWSKNVEVEAGTHTVNIYTKGSTSSTQFWWRGVSNLDVWDRGVAD